MSAAALSQTPLAPSSPTPLSQPTFPLDPPTQPARKVVKEELGGGGVRLNVTVPGPLVQKRFTEIVDILRRCVTLLFNKAGRKAA